MAKREAQSFEWASKFSADGNYLKLEIIGRPEGPQKGQHLTFGIGAYPVEIVEQILAAGHKAVFQQRTSQCETDDERLAYWDTLHDLFVAGDWEREGGKRGMPVVAAWIEAVAAFKTEQSGKKVSAGDIQASWSAQSKEAKAAMKANCEKKFAKEIEAIKEARKSATVDLTDLA